MHKKSLQTRYLEILEGHHADDRWSHFSQLFITSLVLANPSARMEAITSRPLLLAAMGKAASHAGQTTLYLTPMHGKAEMLRTLIANIRAALQHFRLTSEQFKTTDPWAVLMRYVSERIAPTLGPFRPPDALPATG